MGRVPRTTMKPSRLSSLLLATALLLAFPVLCLAEPEPIKPSEAGQVEGLSFLTTKEFSLSLAVLGFGLLFAVVACYLRDKISTAETLFKLLALILLSTLAVILITAGYSDKQMAPIIGLLGTALGYALGKKE